MRSFPINLSHLLSLCLSVILVNASDSETANRSDTFEKKLLLLRDAHQEGRLDLAMSLAESLKDTLTHEARVKPSPPPPHLAADSTIDVNALPAAWSAWAKGWTHCHLLAVKEAAGIVRTNEPITLRLKMFATQLDDPWRELRVARIEPTTRAPQEIPSQVMKHVRSGNEHYCEIVFPGNVPPNSQVQYLILFGNTNAERPNYPIELRTQGEGYALTLDNRHYTAHLSPQMGQLERLISKRQHALELYAGGKGHGEPPSIDWAHDYVDAGHFQKFRIKNWDSSPNYEVIRGPLCTTVRRWGFPHSPIHPLFTPSRMHIDQSYTFHARVPYFFKEGTMEAIVDMEIAAMRDDEWVFSGYSFDETLWIDRDGEVHEGKVAAGHENDLWGVGFFHRTSRDAFVALRLVHEAEGYPSIQHGGTPTLQYDGHGQLWSRYPANEAHLKKGTVFKQHNAYLMMHYPEDTGKAALTQLRRQLMHPLELSTGSISKRLAGMRTGTLARPGETAQVGSLKEKIWQALRSVNDEQLYQIEANIVDLGYVYDVTVNQGVATVLVTMPHKGRPIYQFLETQGGGRVTEGIQERVRRIEGIRDVVVQFSRIPEWTVHRMTDRGRSMLGIKP